MLDDDELELLDDFEEVDEEEEEEEVSVEAGPPRPPPPPPSRRPSAGVPEWATDDVSEPDLLSLAGDDDEPQEQGEEAVDGLVSDLLGED
jgi:hypothetical protein